jgi:purine-nucleoside phosphorylase
MNIQMIREATEYIKSKVDYLPEVAVILGSGLGMMAEEVGNKIIINNESIPHFPVATVVGHAGRFVFGDYMGKKVMMMQGRLHYYEGYPMELLALPIYVMKELGVKTLIVTNACGGINLNFVPGDIMLISDHINFTANNPLIGKNIDEMGPRFTDLSDAYNKELRTMMKDAAKEEKLDLKEGVYMMYTGPNYETPAEIRAFRTLGADAVGMSTVPEVIVANHCGIKVLGVSCITNMACGIFDQKLNHEEVIEVSRQAGEKFITLISKAIEKL